MHNTPWIHVAVPCLLATLSLGSLAGCHFEIEPDFAPDSEASEDFEADYSDEELGGEINGNPWFYTVAKASPRDEGRASFSFYGADVDDPCGYVPRDNKIIFSAPMQVGEFPLVWGEQTVTLVEYRDDDPPMNYIAVLGALDFEEITDEEIVGRMHVVANDSTWVNGRFVATICE